MRKIAQRARQAIFVDGIGLEPVTRYIYHPGMLVMESTLQECLLRFQLERNLLILIDAIGITFEGDSVTQHSKFVGVPHQKW
jgi:hypothetical protein